MHPKDVSKHTTCKPVLWPALHGFLLHARPRPELFQVVYRYPQSPLELECELQLEQLELYPESIESLELELVGE